MFKKIGLGTRRDRDRHEWNERDRHDQRDHRDRGGRR
jgi:hypothetical protein